MPRDYKLYLDDILEAIEKITSYCGKMDLSDFSLDNKTVDAVVRNLEIIGEAANKIPEDIKTRVQGIEWRKITQMRNVLIHEYYGITIEIVWDVVQTKLEPLRAACEKLLKL